MRYIIPTGLALAPVLLLVQPALAFERPAPPQVLFGDLYADVELEPIFPDSKDFADATAKSPPAEILALYHAQKPNSPEGLERFVVRHFDLPAQAATPAAVSEQVPIRRHIDALWTLLTRDEPIVAPYSSLLPLPRPYVVPGGRFSELYYWDSYFVMLGLAESGRRDLLEDMASNFAGLMDTYGHAPNGTRTYYLSRSQPPFFFEMVGLLSPWDPAAAFARYLPELKTEYAYWMEGANELKPGGAHRHAVALADGSILNRYWDDSDAPRDESYREDVELAAATPRPPQEIYRDIRAGAESGWDFSSRWFADARTMASIDTTEIIPVDLNAVMFGLENAIRAGCERAGDHDCAEDFAKRAAARRAAIDRYLWIRPAASISTIAGPRSSQSTISPPQPSIRCSPASRAKHRLRRWRKPSRPNCCSQAGSSRRRSTLDSNGIGRTDGRRCSGSRSRG
jgi:alpha,alpha-trehalase